MPRRPQHRSSPSGEALVRSLFHDHGNALLSYATRLTGNRWAAEDIVQETLLRAWRHADSLDETAGSVRGWLFTVARNLARDRLRRRLASPAEVGPSALEFGVPESDHAEQVVDLMFAADALAQLTNEHRDVIVELYFRGHSVAEAAEALGVPIGTVKSRAHRALHTIRSLMADSMWQSLDEVAR
jgi:RNA polymerase sigma-70 factor, ECF subfamily